MFLDSSQKNLSTTWSFSDTPAVETPQFHTCLLQNVQAPHLRGPVQSSSSCCVSPGLCPDQTACGCPPCVPRMLPFPPRLCSFSSPPVPSLSSPQANSSIPQDSAHIQIAAFPNHCSSLSSPYDSTLQTEVVTRVQVLIHFVDTFVLLSSGYSDRCLIVPPNCRFLGNLFILISRMSITDSRCSLNIIEYECVINLRYSCCLALLIQTTKIFCFLKDSMINEKSCVT